MNEQQRQLPTGREARGPSDDQPEPADNGADVRRALERGGRQLGSQHEHHGTLSPTGLDEEPLQD